jgi:hypothetical protein
LIGRLLLLAKEDPNADQWEVIRFPHYVEVGDELEPYDQRVIDPARPESRLLWPERYDYANYLATRGMYTPYEYSALYQQNPTSPEGNVIKRAWYEPYEYFLSLEDIIGKCIYFDLGASDDPSADKTAGSVKVKLKNNTWMTLWQMSGRWNPNVRNDQIEQFCLRWNAIFPGIAVHLEAGIGEGAFSINELKLQLIGKGINAHTDKVNQSKYTRATAQKDSYLAACGAKRTKFYAGDLFREQGFYNGSDTWIPEFFNEVLKLLFKQTANGVEFVGGKDDLFDSETGAHNKLSIPERPNYFARN